MPTSHTPFQGPRDPAFRVEGKVVSEKRDATWKKRAYREMMVEMDRGIGDVVATLERLDLDRRTLVFFFSDNGATRFGSNGKLRGNKGSLWEGGHLVPAIFRWPSRIEAGTTSARTAITIDLMPTILSLAGAGVPAGHALDGVDLSAVLLEGAALPARPLFWEHHSVAAMRDGPWKLVRKGGKSSLFHLGRDPGEQEDLKERHPERLARMEAALDAWRADVHGDAPR